MAGIRGQDVRHVPLSRDPKANLLRKGLLTVTHRPDLRLVLDRVRNAGKVRDLHGPLAAALGVPRDDLPAIHYVEHHPAHLASAFFVSPFESAACCAIDGFGDFVSTSFAIGSRNHLEVLDKVYFPHSLGMMYTAVTQFLGFHGYGDEFKVMGLAPYGRPRHVDAVRQLVTLTDGGKFELSLDYFRHWSDGVEMEWDDGYPTLGRVYSDRLTHLLGPAREPSAPLTAREEDIAHSLQVVYEDCAMHVLNGLWEHTRQDAVCLAGGCAMNSVANGKVRQRTPFTSVYIQPAAGDNGTALGAAYYVWHETLRHERAFVMEHAYWGTSHDAERVLASVPDRDDEWEYDIEVCPTCAEAARVGASLVASGHVIGWYQGRMVGRARSEPQHLADPIAPMSVADRTKIIPQALSAVRAASPKRRCTPQTRRRIHSRAALIHCAPTSAVIPAVTASGRSGRLRTVARDEPDNLSP
jgi:carbamoyltransferase